MPFPIEPHVQNTSLSSVVDITVPQGTVYITIQASVQNVRLTMDGIAKGASFSSVVRTGTAPTSTIGQVLRTTDAIALIPLDPYVVIRVIEEAGGAKLDYQFFG